VSGIDRKYVLLINIILGQAFLVLLLYAHNYWRAEEFFFTLPPTAMALTVLVVACALPLASIIIAREIARFGISEARSRLMEQRYSFILEAISTGVITTDTGGKVTYANSAALDLLGLRGQPLQGLSLVEISPALAIPLEETGGEARDHSLTLIRDGHEHHFLADVGTLKDDAGSVVGSVILLKDVTEIRNLQEQVLQAERLSALGELAAMAAHEIRNPLTAIRGFLQMIMPRVEGQVERKYVNLILKEADRMNALVRQMAAFSRPAGEGLQPVKVDDLIDESLMLALTADSPGVKVVKRIDAGMPEVLMKQEEMKQVFVNLFRNASEAMQGKGYLTISVEKATQGDGVIVRIQDTGCGIPENLQEKVFRPFVTTKARGMGLGLAICSKIVREHGGEIALSSNEGKGSIFTIFLPQGKATA
jgi:two-component system sensor histidine kinase AtoS